MRRPWKTSVSCRAISSGSKSREQHSCGGVETLGSLGGGADDDTVRGALPASRSYTGSYEETVILIGAAREKDRKR